MPEHPLILKVLCAGLVGCLLLAIGPLIFPYLDIPILPFNVIEAVVSTTLGFAAAACTIGAVTSRPIWVHGSAAPAAAVQGN
jgi:hypothetical protein